MRKSIIIGVVILLVAGSYYLSYRTTQTNARVAEEIRNEPDSARAKRAMLITLEDGREYPVNYLHEGDLVFMGIDGRWWRAFPTDGEGAPVTMVIRGKQFTGRANTILDDPDYKADVFSRLRPTVPKWLPDWLNAKLVVIKLDSQDKK